MLYLRLCDTAAAAWYGYGHFRPWMEEIIALNPGANEPAFEQ